MKTLEQFLAARPRLDPMVKDQMEDALIEFFKASAKDAMGDRYNARYIGRWVAPQWALRWVSMIENDAANTIGCALMHAESDVKNETIRP